MYKNKNIDFKKLTMGVCYYPEHWDESLWEDDLERMKRAGIEVVRIAEFAWNKFEPNEGEYTFKFFDKFMDLALQHDMKVIFCTPTATPPAWLTSKYPEVLNADVDGELIYHGMRRHHNLTSKKYLEFSAKITQTLAEHYCKYPNVIGWQLDNEINCENDLYYSNSDHEAFREYLKSKYTLDELNQAMGTVFWNQTYTDWSQVSLTRRTNQPGQTNPHMKLEEKRFISHSAIEFFRLQADIIRKYKRDDQFITTNGLFAHLDYHKLVTEVLDFITFDNYPAFAFEPHIVPENTNGLKDRNSSYNLTRTRSMSKNFGIMEQQSGAGGWNFRMLQNMPKPGQIRLWTMQAIAHGADFISYFRWRTATMGTEIYWHGINDYSNIDNRRLEEVNKTHEDMQKLNCLVGSTNLAQVSILMDYDNEFDGEDDMWHGPYDRKSRDAFFCQLEKQHIPFDFTYIDDDTKASDLSQYKLLIYPHATIFTKKRADMLKDFITAGGIVVFGARSGYKDLTGQCYMMEFPGYISELCGAVVKDYTSQSQFDETVYIECSDGKAIAPLFSDILEITDGEEVAKFVGNYYAGETAISKKSIGKGACYYVGSVFSEELAALMLTLTGAKTMNSDLVKKLILPETVEVTVRQKGEEQFIFLLNFEAKPAEVSINDSIELKDLISGEVCSERMVLPPYGVAVLTK